MINVNMTDKAGVTLATAGKYCDQNVKVTPSADILRKDEQAKTATPTTSAQDITPDAGKALSKVTVNPITAAIVGDLDADSFAPAIVAAVEGKGVTVPSGTLLDGMASLIESIEAGGGNTSISGTYTLSGAYASIKLLTYEELISVFGNPLPTLIVGFYTLGSNNSQHTSGVFWVSNQENALYIYSGVTSGSSKPSQCSISTTIPEISESSGLVIHRYNSYYYKGNDYYYCVARFDG